MGDIDDLVTALYECVSFTANGRPDWDGLRGLFLEGAQLVKADDDIQPDKSKLSVDRFIALSESFLRQSDLINTGFREVETMRRTERYERIAHVFSSYEAHADAEEKSLIARGSNSIQMVLQHKRWWIVSLLWDEERLD